MMKKYAKPRKSVIVHVDGALATWSTRHGKKREATVPLKWQFNDSGLQRFEKYTVKYFRDPEGELVLKSSMNIPDVRKHGIPGADYMDCCFLKDSGWSDGDRLTRLITYKQP